MKMPAVYIADEELARRLGVSCSLSRWRTEIPARASPISDGPGSVGGCLGGRIGTLVHEKSL
jgi:hypothetical protein